MQCVHVLVCCIGIVSRWLQSYIQQNSCAWGIIMHLIYQWHCCRERENGSYLATYVTCYELMCSHRCRYLLPQPPTAATLREPKCRQDRTMTTVAVIRWPRVSQSVVSLSLTSLSLYQLCCGERERKNPGNYYFPRRVRLRSLTCAGETRRPRHTLAVFLFLCVIPFLLTIALVSMLFLTDNSL